MLTYGHQDRHKVVARLQSAVKNDWIFNVFVNHLVSEVAHDHPFICRPDDAQALGTIKIINDGGCIFSQSRK